MEVWSRTVSIALSSRSTTTEGVHSAAPRVRSLPYHFGDLWTESALPPRGAERAPPASCAGPAQTPVRHGPGSPHGTDLATPPSTVVPQLGCQFQIGPQPIQPLPPPTGSIRLADPLLLGSFAGSALDGGAGCVVQGLAEVGLGKDKSRVEPERLAGSDQWPPPTGPWRRERRRDYSGPSVLTEGRAGWIHGDGQSPRRAGPWRRKRSRGCCGLRRSSGRYRGLAWSDSGVGNSMHGSLP